MIQHDILFHRYAANPILSAKDWPYSINTVFNSGATLLPDGSNLLLVAWKLSGRLYKSEQIWALAKTRVGLQ